MLVEGRYRHTGNAVKILRRLRCSRTKREQVNGPSDAKEEEEYKKKSRAATSKST